MSKKRITILLAAAAIVLLALTLMLSRPTGMDRPTFDNQLPQELADAGYQMLEIRTHAPHLTRQPLSIRWPTAIAQKLGWTGISFGTSESETQFLLESPAKIRLLCRVNYSETKALRVVIPHAAQTKSDAKTLQDTLTKAFPHMSIDLQLSQDESSQKP